MQNLGWFFPHIVLSAIEARSYRCIFSNGSECSQIPIGLINLGSAADVNYTAMACCSSSDDRMANCHLSDSSALQDATKMVESAPRISEYPKIHSCLP